MHVAGKCSIRFKENITLANATMYRESIGVVGYVSRGIIAYSTQQGLCLGIRFVDLNKNPEVNTWNGIDESELELELEIWELVKCKDVE